ncbi:hypothetical protein OG782_16230 [Streptomyces sp. NBC_00876]|uniref:hypothetical protein n=1 Tax=Streptomyces sp. NBC_00876 TaxID=2975853 RepID=UPI003863FCFE|nr:hypothetical protein OG782_16230 [Streptomyces sp. NBC_00876]
MSYASTDMVQLAVQGDVFTWIDGTLGDVQALATTAAGVMAVVATVMAYVKTKSFAGTLTAAILGAVVVFAVSSIPGLSKMVDSEVPEETAVGSYQQLDHTVFLDQPVFEADLR